MFIRVRDFRRAGGFDARLPIMEDAQLCLDVHALGPTSAPPGSRGRIVQVLSEINRTSGRRIAAWGNARATVIQYRISLAWFFGAPPERLKALYDEMYTDAFR
jgi:hypothetical protein